MSEVVHETQHEFWRPPSPLSAGEVMLHAVAEPEALSAMAEACTRCGSEFLPGAGFCHACGGRRPEAISAAARADAAVRAGIWERVVERVQSLGASLSAIKFPAWLRYLHFHEIKRRVGLSTASFVAFLIGIGCVAGALLVGLLTARTFVDWQAIQFYRAEWLLAATASFVAGILLKKSSSRDSD